MTVAAAGRDERSVRTERDALLHVLRVRLDAISRAHVERDAALRLLLGGGVRLVPATLPGRRGVGCNGREEKSVI